MEKDQEIENKSIQKKISIFFSEKREDTLERKAGVAQLVEQLICNQRVGGSSPLASSRNNEWAGTKVVKWGGL